MGLSEQGEGTEWSGELSEQAERIWTLVSLFH